eukprot:TRINITY_DN25717_c0_g1_i1.p1 TRINITY_DN25717_c0_g1~~TRINITY_DN25717_c0_g1_i1.p1  ORF type:complete len:195 (+),score=31.78 TRINITY_DN25717_c0_g1_i1:58-585(+)
MPFPPRETSGRKRPGKPQSKLQDLPEEVLREVVLWIGPGAVSGWGMCNKEMHGIMQTDEIWTTLGKEWGVTCLDAFKMRWGSKIEHVQRVRRHKVMLLLRREREGQASRAEALRVNAPLSEPNTTWRHFKIESWKANPKRPLRRPSSASLRRNPPPFPPTRTPLTPTYRARKWRV